MTILDRILGVFCIAVLTAGLIAIGWLMRGDLDDDPTPNDAGFPVFNCMEDEIMRWVDARHTSECVNIDEYDPGK